MSTKQSDACPNLDNANNENEASDLEMDIELPELNNAESDQDERIDDTNNDKPSSSLSSESPSATHRPSSSVDSRPTSSASHTDTPRLLSRSDSRSSKRLFGHDQSAESDDLQNIDEYSDGDDNEYADDDDNDQPNKVSSNSNVARKKRHQKSPMKQKDHNKRRNIRKVLEENELNVEAQEARRLEAERVQRMMETQQRMREQILQQELEKRKRHGNSTELVPESSSVFAGDMDPCLDDMIILSSDDEPSATSISSRPGYADMIELGSSDDDLQTADVSGSRRSIGSRQGNEQSILKNNDLIPDNGIHTDDRINCPDAAGRVLINIGHPDEDPDVFLSPFLSKKIKRHQIGGVRFMYDCIVENLKAYNEQPGFGCILAHSMGLGKTLQTITFIEVFLRATPAKRVLCIVPINTIQNWHSEFDYWLPKRNLFNVDTDDENMEDENQLSNSNVKADSNDSGPKPLDKNEKINIGRKHRSFNVFSLAEIKSNSERSIEILKWFKEGGVLLMGYELYRILMDEKQFAASIARTKASMSQEKIQTLIKMIKGALLNPGPDLIICDEGHRIKNIKAGISKALKEIKTRRRIVLTGYPLQNNLIEYWCMVDFVRPGFLGTKGEFSNMFEKPILNGQCVDSTPEDKLLMRKRAHVLYTQLKSFVQRRSQSILKEALPRKREFVLYTRMSNIQKKLFIEYFKYVQEDLPRNRLIKVNPLYIFSICVRIWNHPDIMYKTLLGDEQSEVDESAPSTSRGRPKAKNPIVPLFDDLEYPDDFLPPEIKQGRDISHVLDTAWSEPIFENYITGQLQNGYKMQLLLFIVTETIMKGERMLVFSHSLKTLDLIEAYLCDRYIPGQSIHFEKNSSYFRLDGSTSAAERERLINEFNRSSRVHVFLISTKAGSLGINLVGANRAVIFDSSWNPCHDAQAVCRIYRFGQNKSCYIYRLIADNTLEKRIYDRQVTKQGLSNRIVDELNSDINITQGELTKLIEGLEEINEPPPPLFSQNQLDGFDDELLSNVCKQYAFCLTKAPFEHESLLLDVEETKLTPHEKQMAEIEFKMERHRQTIVQPPLPPVQLNFIPPAQSNFPSMDGGYPILPSHVNHYQPNNGYQFMNTNYSNNQPSFGGRPSVDMLNYERHNSSEYDNTAMDYRSVRLMPGIMHPLSHVTIQYMRIPSTISIYDVNEQIITLNYGQEVIYYKAPPNLIVIKTLDGRVIPLTDAQFMNHFGHAIAPLYNNNSNAHTMGNLAPTFNGPSTSSIIQHAPSVAAAAAAPPQLHPMFKASRSRAKNQNGLPLVIDLSSDDD